MANKSNTTAVSQEMLDAIVAKYEQGKSLSRQEKAVLNEYFRENSEKSVEIYNRRQAYLQGNKGIGKRQTRNGGEFVAAGDGTVRTLGQLNQNLWNKNASSSKIVSPGGFKKSGMDADSQIRRAGGITDQSDARRTVEINDDGSATRGYINSKGDFVKNRRLTRGEVDAIMKRASTGATLSLEQQSVYDRALAVAEAKRKAEEKKIADDKAQEQEQARIQALERLGLDPSSQLSQQQINDIEVANAKQAYADGLRLAEKKRQEALAAEQAEQERVARLASYGLAPDDTLSEAQEERIKKGLAETKWDERQQREIDEMNNQYNEAVQSNKYSQEELDRMYGQLQGIKARFYPKKYAEKPIEKLTAQQQWDNGVDVAGGKVVQTSNGGLTLIKVDDPQARREEERNKYVLNKVSKAREAHKSEEEEDGSGEKPFNPKQIIADSFADYDAIYGTKTQERERGAILGINYSADVANGYVGTYEEWLRQFGSEPQDVGVQDAIASPQPETAKKMKPSYM